jgi:hypothetical protein
MVATVGVEQNDSYSGYGTYGILQWTWGRRNTTVDMEQAEYYSGYGADGILQWIWRR